MAIEPLGSVTAMQVQSTTKVQNVETAKQGVENKEVFTSESVPMMDNTTVTVAKAGESNAQQNNENQEKKNNEAIKKAVDNLNKSMKNTSAIYGIHDGTNRVTIKLVDKNTREVIKELPPEKTLDMIEKVWELAGILVDEKR